MSSAGKTRHILVVDDNPGDIDLIRQVIEPIPGMNLHIAHNVMQALAYLNGMAPYVLTPNPDLILLDIRMPMLGGETVIPLVRREPRRVDVKIVMFTSSSRLEDQTSCMALGADDYVVKPSDWHQWKIVLHQILKRYGMLSDTTASGG